MRPPAAVSATETVSPRDLRSAVTSETMGRRASGGKSVEGVGVEVDIVWVKYRGRDGLMRLASTCEVSGPGCARQEKELRQSSRRSLIADGNNARLKLREAID